MNISKIRSLKYSCHRIENPCRMFIQCLIYVVLEVHNITRHKEHKTIIFLPRGSEAIPSEIAKHKHDQDERPRLACFVVRFPFALNVRFSFFFSNPSLIRKDVKVRIGVGGQTFSPWVGGWPDVFPLGEWVAIFWGIEGVTKD